MYTPLNYDQINLAAGTYSPSTVKAYSNKTFDFWVRALFQRACSVIEFDLIEEWEDDNILKYYIEMEKDKIAVEFGNVYRKVGTIYFKTRESAQYMVDNFEDILRMELI